MQQFKFSATFLTPVGYTKSPVNVKYPCSRKDWKYFIYYVLNIDTRESLEFAYWWYCIGWNRLSIVVTINRTAEALFYEMKFYLECGLYFHWESIGNLFHWFPPVDMPYYGIYWIGSFLLRILKLCEESYSKKVPSVSLFFRNFSHSLIELNSRLLPLNISRVSV